MKKKLAVMLSAAMAAGLLGGTSVQASEGEEVTVTIFHHIEEQSSRDGMEEICKALEEKYPGVKYELQGLDNSQYDNMLKTKLAGGDAPDVILGTPKRYIELINAGHIQDITDQEFLKDFDPDLIESMKIDGKVYSVPYSGDGMGVFYNKKVFEDNGIEIPKTHEEMMAAAQKIQDSGIYAFARGFQDGWPAQCEVQADLYGTFLEANPDFFEKIASGEKKFADYPGFKEVMERTAERLEFESGDEFGTDAAKARAMLINGKAGMFIGGTWDVTEFINAGADNEIGFFALPGNTEGNAVLGIAPAGCYMVTSASEHKEEAIHFIEFLTSDEGVAIMSKYAAFVPFQAGDDTADMSPLIKDWVNVIESGDYYNYESREIFVGQQNSTFRTWQEEFAADEERNVDEYIEKLDEQFAAID